MFLNSSPFMLKYLDKTAWATSKVFWIQNEVQADTLPRALMTPSKPAGIQEC